MARRVLVRYRVRPDRVEENLALIRAVFEELSTREASDVRYTSLQLPDGVTFVHLASLERDGSNPLAELASFRAFSAGLADRCDEPPVASDVTVVGSHALF